MNIWPFRKKPYTSKQDPKPVEKRKAPDLSPAIAPFGHTFYVEPIKRYISKQRLPDEPSGSVVRVYLFNEEQKKAAEFAITNPLSGSYRDYPMPGYMRTAYWIEGDQDETKRWINSAMHECLKMKRAVEDEKAKLEALTGFYPPKEM